MIGTILLLTLLAVAAATDLTRHKIYNWNTYPGMLAAWVLNLAGTLWLRVSGSKEELASRLRELGWIGLKDSLLGFLLCGSVVLLCYMVFKVGGGDVKLIAMMGALLGMEHGVMAMLWTFVIAGCVGLIVLVWRVGPGGLFAWAWRQLLWLLRLGRPSPLTAEERAHLPAAAVSGALVPWQRR